MRTRADISALVSSRICHDLVSPLGAIGNGVELLGMSGAPEGPELQLINESVENANARLRFFRIAFGAASADQVISRAEILATLSAASRGGRLAYEWRAQGDLPRRAVRAAFLLIQCIESAMAFGGQITVELQGDDWLITGESDRMNIDTDLWDSLTNTRARVPLSSALVQFALVPEVMDDMKRSLSLTYDTGRITASF
ncbi:histidine phosphotransferase family protein [Octadecabacter sp. R77987]|uniref:histidine phosphotransferase family protein n=1 Tax=Octadecabacter sp. R77987 TaxID=3093874 RepID=UPI00367088D3